MTEIVDLRFARADRLTPSTVVTVTFTDLGGGEYAVRYETQDRGDGWHASPKDIATALRRIAGEVDPARVTVASSLA